MLGALLAALGGAAAVVAGRAALRYRRLGVLPTQVPTLTLQDDGTTLTVRDRAGRLERLPWADVEGIDDSGASIVLRTATDRLALDLDASPPAAVASLADDLRRRWLARERAPTEREAAQIRAVRSVG